MKHDDLILVAKVLPALVAILAVTGLCGYAAKKIGQPRVVGEIIGGLLLGPSVLGLLFPSFHQTLFPAEATKFFVVFANIGLALYMFAVGMGLHHDGSLRKQLKGAGFVAALGIVPTFGLGLLLGYALHASLAPDGVSATTFAVFLGCALSITALPVLARLLDEQQLTRTRLGGLVLTASAIGDVAAWCLLAFALALGHTSGGRSPLVTLAGAAGLGIIAFIVVRPALAWLAHRVEARGALSHGELIFLLGLVLLTGWAADLIGVFAAFGGFILGLVAPRDSLLAQQFQAKVSVVNSALVLPVFFAAAGMNTYIWGLGSPTLIVPLILIILAACVGKYGCSLAARGLGMNWRESLAVGSLMNSRGVMELVIAGAGLAYGLISQEVFSMLVVMTLITTAVALPLSRHLLRLNSPDPLVVPIPAVVGRGG